MQTTNLRADEQEERVYALCNPETSFSDFKYAVLTEKFSTRSYHAFCDELLVVEDAEIFTFLWENVKNSHTKLAYTLGWALTGYHNFCPPNVNPKCIEIVHDEIRKGNASNAFREVYTYHEGLSTIPELLDMLKNDTHRPVLKNIANNSNAWPSTHEYLVDNHKTPSIRMSIAWVTQDNLLLNKIYHGTRSEDIRREVENNSFFVNLKP